MTRTLAEIVLLVALLVAAALIVANNRTIHPAAPGAALPSGASREVRVDAGLPERVQALRSFLSSPPPPAPLRRNPFGFGPAAGTRPGVSAGRSAGNASPTPRPTMELAGIAEETGNGHPNRTAVISAAGQVIFAKEGDRVLSRFLVVRVSADAVYLRDDEGGGEFALVLK